MLPKKPQRHQLVPETPSAPLLNPSMRAYLDNACDNLHIPGPIYRILIQRVGFAIAISSLWSHLHRLKSLSGCRPYSIQSYSLSLLRTRHDYASRSSVKPRTPTSTITTTTWPRGGNKNTLTSAKKLTPSRPGSRMSQSPMMPCKRGFHLGQALPWEAWGCNLKRWHWRRKHLVD
ncbi:uncharacterized protein LOC110264732 [Arachis ipaensis]|uniref:uncharacterized protein LOC110264732 n=1 Tax=Arachis ipaensis TaxID=130454 RepID=UPI000A2B1AE9|nr:uncharacterized protein LOC110264732 [Arachis ipaensis]